MQLVAKSPPKGNLYSKVNGEFVTQSPDKKAAVWLDEQVEAARGKIVTQVVDLTPAIARALLNRNDGNRKVGERKVSEYARDIKNGAWMMNGEPIILSSEGLMNDGQHRCLAVVETDTPIKVILVIGVERETRLTLDRGKMRSIGDYLSMSGYVSAAQIGTTASMAWQYLNFNKLANSADKRPTKSEVMSFIRDNEDHSVGGRPLSVSTAFANRKGAGVVGGRPLVAFCHWVFWGKAGKAAADDFIVALCEGPNLSAGHPILYVRNRLIIERGRLRAYDKAELIFRAWNAWRRNAAVRSLQVVGGELPELEA